MNTPTRTAPIINIPTMSFARLANPIPTGMSIFPWSTFTYIFRIRITGTGIEACAWHLCFLA